MQIIGIVGGVASGKSLVAAQLESLGAAVLDGDRAGHEVLRREEVVRAIRERWGEAVIDAEGQVDRPALGRIVFAPPPKGPTELAELERITHPRIRALLEQRAAEWAAGGARALVLDAPVMLKAGWDEFCSTIVYIDAPEAVRLQRAEQRGWSEEEFRRREASQTPLEQKRALSDRILDNSGDPAATLRQVETLWREISDVAP